MLYFICFQVEQEQLRLKHKLTTENAYFKAKDFDHIGCAPKEELHQFLIGLYGEHIPPATLHEYERLLRSDLYSTGLDKDGIQKVFDMKENDGWYLGQITGPFGFHRLQHKHG
jgi:hypothetical protein